MKRLRFTLPVLLAALFSLPAAVVLAQAGGYDLSWWTVNDGGATFSTGGAYRLGGTIGQPDSGEHSGGNYTLYGGFWNRSLPLLPPSTDPGANTADHGARSNFLPDTGFAPERVTQLSARPPEKDYTTMDDLRLEIPALGLKMDIVGVPLINGEWDVQVYHFNLGASMKF